MLYLTSYDMLYCSCTALLVSCVEHSAHHVHSMRLVYPQTICVCVGLGGGVCLGWVSRSCGGGEGFVGEEAANACGM
jgi:hypothetical protein